MLRGNWYVDKKNDAAIALLNGFIPEEIGVVYDGFI